MRTLISHPLIQVKRPQNVTWFFKSSCHCVINIYEQFLSFIEGWTSCLSPQGLVSLIHRMGSLHKVITKVYIFQGGPQNARSIFFCFFNYWLLYSHHVWHELLLPFWVQVWKILMDYCVVFHGFALQNARSGDLRMPGQISGNNEWDIKNNPTNCF